MYQGSQKIYESTFLEKFVTHALHPDQLETCFSTGRGSPDSIQKYLHSVSDNVNKITTQMNRNTCSRTVSFMMNDGRDRIPFWDNGQFNTQYFANFGPGNSYPVVDMMCQSWHRAFRHPTMLQCSPEQYQIGIDASPFEDIDDVTERTTLFKKRNTRNASFQDQSVPTSHMGTSKHPVRTAHLQADSPTTYGSPVSSRKPDAPPQASGPSSPSDVVQSRTFATMPLWKKALIEDHRERLRERWPQSQKLRQPSRDLAGYVDRAIRQGDLKRLAPGPQRLAESVGPPRFALQSVQGEEAPYSTNSIFQTRAPTERSQDKVACASGKVEFNRSASNSTRAKRSSDQASDDQRKKRQKNNQKAEQSKTSKSMSGATKKGASAHSRSNGDFAHTMPYHGASKELEQHQRLPPDAYFEKTSNEELPAWRCGIRHPMGYYYNAGDRKNCAGCFTALSENPKHKMMDFYLPSRSYFYQHAPGITWKPSKPQGKARRSKHMSHNSIAKDTYWDAIGNGATTDEALAKAIEAVETSVHAKAQKKEKKEPTPVPIPEPFDLGPHPSGSKTMEHGQTLPLGAYWGKQSRYDEFSWRCDVNHALGRYYLAGDVKSCPGCGSCRTGPGQHPKMDFYLPAGSIIRQEAPDLVKWKPRRPYNLTKPSKKAKQVVTHNQICSKTYWQLIDARREPVKGGANEEALKLAIETTDAQIDAKIAASQMRLEETVGSQVGRSDSNKKGKDKHQGRVNRQIEAEDSDIGRRGPNKPQINSLDPPNSMIPGKNKSHMVELDDDELDEVSEYDTDQESDAQQAASSMSSEDESTSDSDSE